MIMAQVRFVLSRHFCLSPECAKITPYWPLINTRKTMRQLKCLLIVSSILITTLITKGVTTGFPTEIKPFNSRNDSINHYVGELFGGGVVFSLDESKQHGLICSMSDIRDPFSSQSDLKQNPIPIKNEQDTKALMSKDYAVNNRDRAVDLCDSYSNSNYGTGIFSNWHLPTIDELKILYNVKDEINKVLEKFGNSATDPLIKVYWSSSKMRSEIMNSYYQFNFEDGAIIISPNLTEKTYVRAVRTF